MKQDEQYFQQIDEPYSLKKIVMIWLSSALPMFILAYIISPLITKIIGWKPIIVYWFAVNVGLIWQFLLSLIILRIDGNKLNWRTVITRMRYQKPINPLNGKSSYWVLLWTIPFILLSAIVQLGVIHLPNVDALLLPLIKNLPQYEMSDLSVNEFKGKWWILGMYLFTAIFNYFLGEEFIYWGILLPKMKGVFGKVDWFFAGILFGFYHLHKPQIILSTALYFGFIFAFPSKLFKSNWMAVIIHGTEGVLGLFMVINAIIGNHN